MPSKHRPELTDAAKPATFEVEAYNERGEMVPTAIAGEHPLTLYLDKREIVTLMTLGHAPEALALGYLRNQGLVPAVEAIAAVWLPRGDRYSEIRTEQTAQQRKVEMSYIGG